MKTIRFALSVLIPLLSIAQSFGAINLRVYPKSAYMVTVEEIEGGGYAFLTTGIDPYVSTRMIGDQPLSETDTHLTFEYKSTTGVSRIHSYFIGDDGSYQYLGTLFNLEPSEEWVKVSADISSHITGYEWGSPFGGMRLDLGAEANKDISIRNLRIDDSEEEYIPDEGDEEAYFQHILSLGLPVLKIETDEREEPTYDISNPPEGALGGTIKNATKVPSSMTIYNPDGTIRYESGEYEKGVSGLTVKVRGNGSARVGRNPYKLKLQKKADLLNRGDKKFADKNWVLLNDLRMQNFFGQKVAELVGMEYVPQMEFVNVWFNGDYRGLYALAESVERNTDCRIDVDKTGFIFELDQYWWNEPGYIGSKYLPIVGWTFKYPDYEEIPIEQLADLGCHIEEFEKSLTSSNYTDFIDVESFAKFILAHDILGSKDYQGANEYFKIYDFSAEEKKIYMPVLWDLETKDPDPDAWSNIHHSKLFTDLFSNNENCEFIREFVRLWDTQRETIINGMDKALMIGDGTEETGDALISEEFQALFDKSIKANRCHWTISSNLVQQNINDMRSRIEGRYAFIDNGVRELENSIPSVPVGVDRIGSDISIMDNAVYDLFGRKVNNPAPGIYVKNGKKFVVK